MLSRLRRLLNKMVGEEEIFFTIPNTFLPPRFREISEGRNMKLLLDRDMVLHVRWEGALSSKHHPLTPGAACRLLGEVDRRVATYQKDVNIYHRFVRKFAEKPFDGHRNNPVGWEREPQPAEEEKTTEVPAKIRVEETELCVGTSDVGGESPMPDMDY